MKLADVLAKITNLQAQITANLTSGAASVAALAILANVKLHDLTNPIDGQTKPVVDSTRWRIVTGTVVATTSAAGIVTVTFPTAFPNGLVSVVVQNGDDTVTDAVAFSHGGTKTGFEIRAYHGSGAACNALLMRWNYIAIGW